jgi:23S rRNA (uracil1939-C5)-methyltransferase
VLQEATKITRVNPKIMHNQGEKKGWVISLNDMSDSRLEQAQPLCPYFGECGGCDLQHLAYSEQVQLKKKGLEALFQKFTGTVIHDVIPSPKVYGYRNRITLHHDGKNWGYFKRSSHDIIAIDQCPIASKDLNQKLAKLDKSALKKEKEFELREDDSVAFLQINTEQNENLKNVVVNLLPRQKTQRVLELYAGSGNLTFVVAPLVRNIITVENHPEAVRRAQEKCRNLGLKKIKFRQELASDAIFDLVQNCEIFDTVIVDPPREGLMAVAAKLPQLKAKTIIYVSCNPATFRHDAEALAQKSYDLKSITPLDMFPQTRHVEIVGVFKKS